MSSSNVASWPVHRFLKRQVRWSSIPISLLRWLSTLCSVFPPALALTSYSSPGLHFSHFLQVSILMSLELAVFVWLYISNKLETLSDLAFTKEAQREEVGLEFCPNKGLTIHQAQNITVFSVHESRKHHQKQPSDRKPGTQFGAWVGYGLKIGSCPSSRLGEANEKQPDSEIGWYHT